jgi:cytosine/uracil/thiamine/allantoin permease
MGESFDTRKTRVAYNPDIGYVPLQTTLFGYPLASALPCLYGILVAACAKKLTGTAYWNMWDVMKYMLAQYPDNHGARFGIFLISVAMALSYLAGKWFFILVSVAIV